MGFVGKAKTAVLKALTLGGSAAIERSIRDYAAARTDYDNSVSEFNAAKQCFTAAVEQLGKEADECIKLLKDWQCLVKDLSRNRLTSQVLSMPSYGVPSLVMVEQMIAAFDAAVTAGIGAGAGIAASAGAWLLIAHLGTASTGAAIGGLAGVAAHNAILAWFGGGALAAGGGGMALGGFVVGGIVALPIVAYSAYKSYKEASRIDTATEKVRESATENRANVERLRLLRSSADNLIIGLSAERLNHKKVYESLCQKAFNLAQEAAKGADDFAKVMSAAANLQGASA